jgi:hypothetical protein
LVLLPGYRAELAELKYHGQRSNLNTTLSSYVIAGAKSSRADASLGRVAERKAAR